MDIQNRGWKILINNIILFIYIESEVALNFLVNIRRAQYVFLYAVEKMNYKTLVFVTFFGKFASVQRCVIIVVIKTLWSENFKNKGKKIIFLLFQNKLLTFGEY